MTALNDQVEPAASDDHAVPRFTWWNRLGTTEWVQYEFDGPRRVTRSEVYWFDDTGLGRCRLPAAWRLLARTADGWQPVGGSTTVPITPDAYNRLEFGPVETTALRLEVRLQPEFSGGILEWRVECVR